MSCSSLNACRPSIWLASPPFCRWLADDLSAEGLEASGLEASGLEAGDRVEQDTAHAVAKYEMASGQQPRKALYPVQALCLDAERVGWAVARGAAPAQIVSMLTEALGRPPSRRVQQRLRAWAKAGEQVTIRPLMALETSDAKIMRTLRSRAHVRHHLGETLSPTRVSVNPQTTKALSQRLAKLGYYTAARLSDSASSAGDTAADNAVEDNTVKGNAVEDNAVADNAGWQITKLQITPLCPIDRQSIRKRCGCWQRSISSLVATWRYPLIYPSALQHMLAQELPLEKRAAAEFAARQIAEQLEASLRGYLRLPSWQFTKQQAALLPMLEGAIADQQQLRIRYWGAGRGEKTVRLVTPYHLEQREHVLYLNAYCHLRDDERIFRVDRIESCEIIQP